MVPAIFISIHNDRKPSSTIRMGEQFWVLTLFTDKLNGLSTDLGFAVYTDGTKSMIDVFASH
jgi:cation/acetate symporter